MIILAMWEVGTTKLGTRTRPKIVLKIAVKFERDGKISQA